MTKRANLLITIHLIVVLLCSCKQQESNSINLTQNNIISLRKVEDFGSIKTIMISNYSGKDIYLPYEYSWLDPSKVYVTHQIICKNDNGTSINLSSGQHSLPIINKLEDGKEIHFSIEQIPTDYNKYIDCKVVIIYYENEKIANLINTKIDHLNQSEKGFIDSNKKFAELDIYSR